MKKLLTATAIVAALSTGTLTSTAHSAAHTNAFMGYDVKAFEKGVALRASNLIGKFVYTTVNPGWDSWDWNSTTERKEGEWDNIGDVNDVILTADGKVAAVIVGVGGFLGIGEKDVAIKMSDLKLLREGENESGFFVAIKADKKALMDAPEYK